MNSKRRVPDVRTPAPRPAVSIAHGATGVFKTLLTVFALLAGTAVRAQSIDGGLTWDGWTDRGASNELGVGSGPASEVYRVYSTFFYFNNHTRTNTGEIGGGPTGGTTGFGTGSFSAGAFATGNAILGIGLQVVSGGRVGDWTFVKFDLDNDSFRPATTVGGTDGQTSFSTWSEKGDFTVSFAGIGSGAWTAQEISIQNGNGTAYGGTSQAGLGFPGYIAGGSTGYDFPVRAFRRGTDSFQAFFDATAMQSRYGPVGMGAFDQSVGIAMQGFSGGSNNVAFSVPLTPVPEPSTSSILVAGIAMMLLVRRFFSGTA